VGMAASLLLCIVAAVTVPVMAPTAPPITAPVKRRILRTARRRRSSGVQSLGYCRGSEMPQQRRHKRQHDQTALPRSSSHQLDHIARRRDGRVSHDRIVRLAL
jgi:hypothetical protein